MAIKSLELKNPARRAVPAIVAALCVLAVYFSVKWCFGNVVVAQAEIKEVAELGTRLAPDDPQTHYALAALLENSFLPEDSARSIEEYEKAVSLAPEDYRLWLALGKARDRAGDAQGAERALRKAAELAPNYSQIHWTLGNLLLRQGNEEEAFLEIRRAVENDPGLANPAVFTAWQVYEGDAAQISRKIGDSVPIRAELAMFLAKQQRFEEASEIWNSLPENERRTVYREKGEELLRAFVAAKKFRAALAIQSQIADSEGERFALGEIANNGFENPVKTSGASVFDWQIADGLQPQIAFDNNQKRGGNRSLVIVFNSPTGQESRTVQQTVAVEGGKRYRLEAFYRADLKTSAGVKWDVVDASDGKVLVATNFAENNADWSPLAAEFSASPATEAVTILFSRPICKTTICPISGKIWFDDFNLRKIE